MSGFQNLTLKNVHKVTIFNVLIDFKSSKFMRIFVAIPSPHSTRPTVLCSLDMQFDKQAVVLLPGRERWEYRSLTSFRGRTRFSLFLMLPLSFNTNFDVVTVLKQSAYREIIIGKIVSYAPRAGSPSF